MTGLSRRLQRSASISVIHNFMYCFFTEFIFKWNKMIVFVKQEHLVMLYLCRVTVLLMERKSYTKSGRKWRSFIDSSKPIPPLPAY